MAQLQIERYKDIQTIWENRETGKRCNVCVFPAQCSFFFFFDSCISLFSPFSSVSSSNCPHQQKAFNYKASAGLCPRNLKDYVVYTDYCEHGYVLRFVLSPSFLYLPFATLCIPPWLTCLTSTAVISTAFTELINRVEGWVLLNWDISFSLSLAHTDDYLEKRNACVRKGRRTIFFFFFCLVPKTSTDIKETVNEIVNLPFSQSNHSSKWVCDIILLFVPILLKIYKI